MSKLTLTLPKHRLHLNLVRRRGETIEPFLPTYSQIKSVRKGSKISRIFRHIFEHEKINKVLGLNLALVTALTVVAPTQASIPPSIAEDQTIVQNVLVLTTQKGIRYPVDNAKVSQGYRFYHPAIDFDGNTGDPIKPIMSGVVAGVDYSKFAYGNAVIVDHGNGITSLYAHLSKILVKVGDFVEANTTIGLMGATGRASGDHLHLEIRDHNIPINPALVLH
jgi:murein DD-endopeptidase MepM/ murein hydrolase activator NlpD